jgi:signal transduction histidine kinase
MLSQIFRRIENSVININEGVNLCSYAIRQNNIALKLELAGNLPLINIDNFQIEQVLINLIHNSIDAIPGSTEEKKGQIVIQSCLMPNNEIEVRVKDNGSGIQNDQKLKILMPFHSTKADGMGMGLSISHSLIEAHNGKLHFNSLIGKGSTFYFTLPI